MKVSNTNIVEKCDEIEQYLNDKTHDTYNEFLPEDFTDPEMADMYEPFIKDVNRQLAKVKDATPQKKSLKHKFTKGKSGKRKVTGRRKKGEKKAQKEEKPKRKVKSSSGKSSSGKSSKTSTKRESEKPSKPKVGEAAPWQSTLRRFATMCGKERTVTSVRKFVKEIQANFSAKLKGKTPHIELIREIQEKLLPYANKIDERKVQLPNWADFKTKCQAAAKEWTVSKSEPKPELKTTALSGLKKKTSPRKVKKAR